jgi:hypothetical protein
MAKRANSYDPTARTPAVGSRWVWEIDSFAARALIEVTEVIWNGEEWWVRTRSLLAHGLPFTHGACRGGTDLNDLSRFCEAATPVGAALPGTWRESTPVAAGIPAGGPQQ